MLGDHLYRVSRIKKTGNYLLSIDEVYPYIEIEGILYHVFFNMTSVNQNNELEYVREGGCSHKNLVDVLQHFRRLEVEKAIFTCNDFTFAVILTTDRFIFFDSHERTYTGYPVDDVITKGASVLCTCYTIDGLAFRLMFNCGLSRRLKSKSKKKETQ